MKNSDFLMHMIVIIKDLFTLIFLQINIYCTCKLANFRTHSHHILPISLSVSPWSLVKFQHQDSAPKLNFKTHKTWTELEATFKFEGKHHEAAIRRICVNTHKLIFCVCVCAPFERNLLAVIYIIRESLNHLYEIRFDYSH